MKGPVVFDFDKTLTEKDTLIGFYREASTSTIVFYIKYLVLLAAAIIYKMRMISNDSLKKVGIWLYLKGKTKDEVKKIGLNYSSKIQLNSIYTSEFLKYPREEVIVLSASFEDYLKPLFANIEVIGSKLKYDNRNIVVGLLRNMYGINKKKYLQNENTYSIKYLYTDSYSDLPLMEISEQVFIIKENSISKKV